MRKENSDKECKQSKISLLRVHFTSVIVLHHSSPKLLCVFFFFFSFVAKSISFIKKQKQTCNLSTKPQTLREGENFV